MNALRQLTQPGAEGLLSALAQGTGMDQEQLLGLLAQAQSRGRGGGRAAAAGSPVAGARNSAPAPSAAPTPSAGASQPSTAAASSNVQNALRNVLGRLGQQPAASSPAVVDATPSLVDVVDPDKIIASGLFDQPDVVQVRT